MAQEAENVSFVHGHYLLEVFTVAVGKVWLGFVGTSSDYVPPTSWAPPVHEATGGHAIQTSPTATIICQRKEK